MTRDEPPVTAGIATETVSSARLRSSLDQAVARLKKAGAKLLGETPVSLGGKTQLVVVRDPDGNFIELIGPTKD